MAANEEGDRRIVTSQPKYPALAEKQSRIETFDDRWETDRKKRLAAAGFFSDRCSARDQTKCFYCGGILCDWQPDDDEWIEHTRFFPKCGFVQQAKGCVFIDIIQQLNKENQRVTHSMVEDEACRRGVLNTILAVEGQQVQIHCIKCKVRNVSSLILPCRHAVCCVDCSSGIMNCPECGQIIEGRCGVTLTNKKDRPNQMEHSM